MGTLSGCKRRLALTSIRDQAEPKKASNRHRPGGGFGNGGGNLGDANRQRAAVVTINVIVDA